MEIHRFSFDTKKAHDLRNAINDRGKFSMERIAPKTKEIHKPYNAWDRLCAAMDRLDDTINYVNTLELGKICNGMAAFDFYEFINCSYVIIECVKVVVQIFELEPRIIENIEKSTEVFGTRYSTIGNDGRFFEYIRSLCGIHPLCTNRQKEYLSGSIFHCCPFVAWTDRGYINSNQYDNADLIAQIYTTNSSYPLTISLYIKEFEKYLNKWIDSIPSVIVDKHNYVEEKYAHLRTIPLKELSDFDGNYIEYIQHLKSEYTKRVDTGTDYILDEFIAVFSLVPSNCVNQRKLEKYKNAILYALGFLQNSLQSMSFDGFENTGMAYPDRNIETDLYIELGSPFFLNSAFSKHSYAMEKVHYLSPNNDAHSYDKKFARRLLENLKELINEYVYFTNEEPDEEVFVLLKLALYLEALKRKSLINKNIPNEALYRETLLTQTELDQLHLEEPAKKVSQEDFDKFSAFLESYGQ